MQHLWVCDIDDFLCRMNYHYITHTSFPYKVIELAQTQSVPEGFPEVAWNRCGGLCEAPDINETCEYNETIPDYKALELRRAYYRCSILYMTG